VTDGLSRLQLLGRRICFTGACYFLALWVLFALVNRWGSLLELAMLVTLPFCWMAPFGSLHGWYSPPTSGRSTSIPALKSRLTQAREKSHASSHRFARCWRLHKSHSARGKSTWGQTGDTSGIFHQAARRSYRWCSPPTSWRGYSRDSRLDCLQLVIALAKAC